MVSEEAVTESQTVLEMLHPEARKLVLELDDNGLKETIRRAVSAEDFERVFEFPFYNGLGEVERYYNADQRAVKSTAANGCFVAKCPGFNPALETRVLTVEGSVVPFRAALPQKAGEIQKLSDSCNYVGVYKRVV